MYTALIVVIIIISLLLMLVVLAQNPKGGGLSSQFGGSGTSQLMGVKKTGDFLEKATWSLAIVLFVATLAASKMSPEPTNTPSSPNLENAGEQAQPPMLQPQNQPNSGAEEDGNEALENLLNEEASGDTTSTE